MWRYLLGAVAALVLALAGVLLANGRASVDPLLPSAPAAIAGGKAGQALPDSAPEATLRTREQKRFSRYDKDRDGKITREEYLLSRRKAYDRLDTDRNGALSFDEWAAKTTGKFAEADRDKSGAMTAAEFTATAPKRAARPRCVCPEPAAGDD